MTKREWIDSLVEKARAKFESNPKGTVNILECHNYVLRVTPYFSVGGGHDVVLDRYGNAECVSVHVGGLSNGKVDYRTNYGNIGVAELDEKGVDKVVGYISSIVTRNYNTYGNGRKK